MAAAAKTREKPIVGVLLGVVLLLFFGLFPDPVVRWARNGTGLVPSMPPAAAIPSPAGH